MYKTFKFRLYPTKENEILLNKSFGCSRFVYNYYLSNIKNNDFISRSIIGMDTYYPLIQKCNVCGNIDKKYKNLNEREYKCFKCYNEIDRDLNSSINIIYEGIKLYMKEVLI